MARIAWIEDDHEKVSDLVKLVKNDQHEIFPYGSWQEVEDHIETICACDAIILDIILRTFDDSYEGDPYLGLSILEKLRKEWNYKGPVIVCSRVKNQVVIQRLRDLGAEILQKPVRPSVLHNIVSEVLKASQ